MIANSILRPFLVNGLVNKKIRVKEFWQKPWEISDLILKYFILFSENSFYVSFKSCNYFASILKLKNNFFYRFISMTKKYFKNLQGISGNFKRFQRFQWILTNFMNLKRFYRIFDEISTISRDFRDFQRIFWEL